MVRIFIYDGKEYPDPDSNLTTDEVRQNLANFFPELSNAETKETKRGDDKVFTFTKRTGTKGSLLGIPRRWRHVKCGPGVCAVHRSHYAGGDEDVHKKLRQGICPSCGGNSRMMFR